MTTSISMLPLGTSGTSGTSGSSGTAAGTSGSSGSSGSSGGSGTSGTAGTALYTIEARTDDLSATAANAGRIWMRTDQTSATVKGVIQYTDSGTAAYAVKTFGLS